MRQLAHVSADDLKLFKSVNGHAWHELYGVSFDQLGAVLRQEGARSRLIGLKENNIIGI